MGKNTFEVTDADFQDNVIQSEHPVLVDFWAEWCGPCKMIAPVLEEIAAENPETLRIGKLDIDSNQQTAMQYGVRSIPTMILFKDGKEAERVVGFMPKERLLSKLRAHIA